MSFSVCQGVWLSEYLFWNEHWDKKKTPEYLNIW